MKKEFKDKAIIQLKKAMGTMKKVTQMVEEEKYCIEILQQSLAAAGLLKAANKTILENHLNCCFREGLKNNNKKNHDKLIAEVLHIVNKI